MPRNRWFAKPQLRSVVLDICDLCLAGKGGICHTPGCAFWLKTAPDVPLDVNEDHPRPCDLDQVKR